MSERTDLIETDDGEDGWDFIASYEENSMPGKLDARVVSYGDSDRRLLDNPSESENIGEVYAVDAESVEDGSARDYLSEKLLEEEQQEDTFQMEGLDPI